MSRRQDSTEPQSDDLIRAAFERAPDAQAMVDSRRRFVAVNSAFHRLFARDGARFDGRTFDDICLNPADAATYFAAGSHHAIFAAADGSGFSASLRVEALPEHDGAHLTIVPSGSIAAAESAALQRLAGGIAHDFRNVLAVIKGNIDVALMRSTDPRAASVLAEANLAADLGAAMTEKLFSFAHRRAEPVETITVATALESVEPLLRAVAGDDVEFSLSVSVSLSGDQAAHIAASMTSFQSALINLVANARDATESGGSVAVVGELEIVAQPRTILSGDLSAGRYIRIGVTDTGAGMPQSVRGRALDPFFTTKSGGAGFGLGLAQVQAFALANKGAVDIDSAVGQGSTVSVYLRTA